MIRGNQRAFSVLLLTLLTTGTALPSSSQASNLKAACSALLGKSIDFAVEKVQENEAYQNAIIHVLQAAANRRYAVKVNEADTTHDGLSVIKERGVHGILFTFEHPGLIDPALTQAHFGLDFHPRPLVAEDVYTNLKPIMDMSRALAVPAVEKHKEDAAELVEALADAVAAGLAAGDNFMVAPSGHIKSGNEEDIQNQSIVEKIVKKYPNVRIVMIRSSGIYGSMFTSGKTGNKPSLNAKTLYKYVNGNTLGAFIRGAKRNVRFEVKDAVDFPKNGTRQAMNAYMKSYMDAGNNDNTFAPYKKGQPTLLAPRVYPPKTAQSLDPAKRAELINSIPQEVKDIVARAVTEETQVTPVDAQTTINATGVDSLGLVNIVTEVEEALHIKINDNNFPTTVGDIMVGANKALLIRDGKLTDDGSDAPAIRLDPRWALTEFRSREASVAKSKTVLGAFYETARLYPDEIAGADEINGAVTFRDMVFAVSSLSQVLAELPDTTIGVMLPAGVGSEIMTYSLLAAGKNPFEVNYSQGAETIKETLNSLKITHVITSNVFVDKLAQKNIHVDPIKDRFLEIDTLKGQVTTFMGAKALARAMFKTFWRESLFAKKSKYSVVLSTSGSSGKPKAVGLTSRNQLTNIREAFRLFNFTKKDKIIGILPYFHSFGATAVKVLSKASGIPAFLMANPTAYGEISNAIEATGSTILMGTPTFVAGISDKANPGQLKTIRLIMVGAEALTQEKRDKIEKAMPTAVIVEGYGITEASPIVAVNPPDAPIPGTLGRILPSIDYAIVNPQTLEPVKVGETGMLFIRGPSVFSGYLNTDENPFKLLKVARTDLVGKTIGRVLEKYRYHKDWYETGDMVQEVAPRHIKMVGRMKRFRKRGGEMISLPAIEEALAPSFAGGTSDGPTFIVESGGDNMPFVLFTTMRFGATESEARQFIREQQKDLGMSNSTMIDEVRYVDTLPVLGTGKADPRALELLLKAEFAEANAKGEATAP